MKNKILISLIFLLPISAYSFEDIYLECSEKGEVTHIFGIKQSLFDKISSRTHEDVDLAKTFVADSNWNQLQSDFEGYFTFVTENQIDAGSYHINRTTGKASLTIRGEGKFSLGDCSEISKSSAEKKAQNLYQPKPIKRKF